MSIRLPLTTVLDVTDSSTGSTSVAGGIAYPFKLPQDTDNCIVAFSPSVATAGISATFQTSPDGGTTWYDVARTSIATASPSGVGPQFLSIPTIVDTGARNIYSSSLIATGSLIGVISNGTAAASTLGSGQNSGLPIMGIQNRIFLIQQSGISASQGSRVQVLVNNQSATTS